MIQIIGFIIVVYAITRLLQTPFEHAAYQVTWMGMGFRSRSALVCLISLVGLLILWLLAATLSDMGVQVGEALKRL